MARWQGFLTLNFVCFHIISSIDISTRFFRLVAAAGVAYTAAQDFCQGKSDRGVWHYFVFVFIVTLFTKHVSIPFVAWKHMAMTYPTMISLAPFNSIAKTLWALNRFAAPRHGKRHTASAMMHNWSSTTGLTSLIVFDRRLIDQSSFAVWVLDYCHNANAGRNSLVDVGLVQDWRWLCQGAVF